MLIVTKENTRILILVLLFLSPLITTAQLKLTSVGIAADRVPAARYIRPEDSVRTMSKTVQTRYAIDLTFSVLNRIDTATRKINLITASVRGHYTSLLNKDYQRKVFPDRMLATDIGVQYYKSLNNRWAALSFLQGGVYSDLDAVSGSDIFVAGGIIFIKQYKPNFSVGYGLMAHNSFGNVILWPALSVQWKMGGRYQLQVNVPDNGIGLLYNVGISYMRTERHSLTFAFRPRQISYDATTISNNRLMSYWELPLGVESRWKLKRCSFFAGTGLMALRSVQYGEKSLSKMFEKYPAHRLSANFYISAGMQVHL